MSKLNRNKLALLLLPLTIAGWLFFGGQASAQATFNYTDHLMDDSVFRAYNTMSASDIQTFLQNEGSGLTNFSDTEVCGNDTRGAMMAQYSSYFSCGTQQRASKIIYDTAQAYGINPQILLATMQKEQSLVTTPNPTSSQLNYAMGYGCPDSGSCSYPGFFTQVAWAAWQFRYDYEAINGNSYGGWSSSAYPCPGPTNTTWSSSNAFYYNAPLKTGNTVSFYDDYGTAYTTITLPNASTSSLYCYTPHVYPGSSQEYYSGSYWFVYYYDLWFVPYAAHYYSQSPYPQVNSGTVNSVYLMYTNVGSANWYDDTSIGSAPAGTNPVHLSTAHTMNRSSVFSADWPSPSRPALNFAAVYEADGVTKAANQHIVLPGQIVQFVFNMTVPGNLSPQTYAEYFQPVLENTAGTFPDPWTYLNIGVNQTAALSWSSQSAYPTVYPSDTQEISLSFTNSGNIPAYDNQSIGSAPQGNYPTHLATSCPINSNSDFQAADWANPSRPAVNFAAVYEADGVTKAANQHIAQPGQIIKFTYGIKVPAGYTANTYKLCLQPVLEGTGGTYSNQGVYTNVTVPSAPVVTLSATPGSLQAISGEPGSFSATLLNVGNAALASGSTIVTPSGSTYSDSSWPAPTTLAAVNTSIAAGASTTVNLTYLAPIASTTTDTALSLQLNDNNNAAVHDSNMSLPVHLAAPNYAANYAGESAFPNFTYGQTQFVYFKYKNTGNKPWYDDSSLGTAPSRSPLPTHLATDAPLNRNSGFAYNWPWSAADRAATNFSAVYESDGTTQAADQHVVQPGQIAKFTFTVAAASWVQPGTYREYFRPIIEGTSNGGIGFQWTYLDITLNAPKYAASYYSQSAYPSLTAGQAATGFMEYKNSGNVPWYDDNSIGSAPAKDKLYPVHLATSHAINRNSAFGASWPSTNRPALTFSAVYESDGTTQTDNQHVVQPGQIAKFTFSLTDPTNQPPGTYQEFFQPLAEGSMYGEFNDPWTFLDVTAQ